MAILGMATVAVCYGKRSCDLAIQVATRGHRCLLGVDWFATLGISLQGVLCVQEQSLQGYCPRI